MKYSMIFFEYNTEILSNGHAPKEEKNITSFAGFRCTIRKALKAKEASKKPLRAQGATVINLQLEGFALSQISPQYPRWQKTPNSENWQFIFTFPILLVCFQPLFVYFYNFWHKWWFSMGFLSLFVLGFRVHKSSHECCCLCPVL